MDARALVRPSEEQVRQIEEQDRKFLMIALEVYTKKNNMQVIPISINNYFSGYYSMTTLLCYLILLLLLSSLNGHVVYQHLSKQTHIS